MCSGGSGGFVISLSPPRPEFSLRSAYVEFVVDKVALGQYFSEYFSFF